jgi:hypothetical protein
LWQRLAVEKIAAEHELYLLVAKDDPPGRREPRHFSYYALNLAAIRNRMTRSVPFPEAGTSAAGRMDFEPHFEGRWASLPHEALAWLREHRIGAIVKFGLGLLRVPPADILPAPILSFHHGDPRRYRGRPAGFYEMLNGERFMGQIVQRLSNRLDGARSWHSRTAGSRRTATKRR